MTCRWPDPLESFLPPAATVTTAPVSRPLGVPEDEAPSCLRCVAHAAGCLPVLRLVQGCNNGLRARSLELSYVWLTSSADSFSELGLTTDDDRGNFGMSRVHQVMLRKGSYRVDYRLIHGFSHCKGFPLGFKRSHDILSSVQHRFTAMLENMGDNHLVDRFFELPASITVTSDGP